MHAEAHVGKVRGAGERSGVLCQSCAPRSAEGPASAPDAAAFSNSKLLASVSIMSVGSFLDVRSGSACFVQNTGEKKERSFAAL
jgi:hypothetical protein